MVDVAFHLKLVRIFFSDSAPGTFAISAECDTSIGSNDPSEGFFSFSFFFLYREQKLPDESIMKEEEVISSSQSPKDYKLVRYVRL